MAEVAAFQLVMARSIQILLAAFFGAALAVFLYAYLNHAKPDGFATVIAILVGGLVFAVVFPNIEELTIGPKGLHTKLSQQQKEIDALKFLVSGFVTGDELTHLRKLAASAADQPFPFECWDGFLEDLRRLRSLGLIENIKVDWEFAQLPEQGNLREYVAITDRGREYLKLRDQVTPSHRKPPS